MAGIDYTIPNQIKGIQLESPMNAMAQAMQLRGLQEASQLNALKAQEYQQDVAEKNALAQIYANPKLKYGSPEFFAEVSHRAPRFFEKIATGEAQRQTALSTQEAREAETEKRKYDLSQAQRKEQTDALNVRLKQFNEAFPAYNIQSAEDVQDRIIAMANDETLGPLATQFGPLGDTIARNVAEYNRNPRNYIARLAGVSAEKILEAADARKAEAYNNYKVGEIFSGRTPLSQEAYEQQVGSAVAAPAPASTPAPVPVDATTPAAKVGEPVVAEAKRDGIDYLHPEAKRLLALAATAKTQAERQAYEAAAGRIQTAFEEDVKVQRKRTELPQDAQDVANMRAKVRELRKQAPTPENLQEINDLLKIIDETIKGKAPRISQKVEVSTEKKYGEKFAGNIADSDVALRDAAERAPDTAANANRILSLLQSGQVITGSAANVKLQMAKFLNLGGGNDSEAVTNTEILISSLADSTLGAIKSSGLGSGQGFTDKDREFLERAKSGQITYEAASLKRLAELAHKAAGATADKWNKRVKTIPRSAIEGTGISTEPITVPSMQSAPRRQLPAKNADGWELKEDANGRRAYVSPDGKQYKEVK